MKLVTSAQMKAIDKRAVSELKIPGIILMENAAGEIYSVISSIDGYTDKKYLVISGPGNNGGDGFAVARKLFLKGIDVSVITLVKENDIKGIAKINYEVLQNIGANVTYLSDVDMIKKAVAQSDIIIDAIFGTGLKKDVEGIYKSAIDLINTSGVFIISVDIPSGLDSDTGKPRGQAVKADITVTFAYEKIGHAVYPGRSLCGKVVTADIGIPDSLTQDEKIKNFVVKEQDIRKLIRFLRRGFDTHKGNFGHVLVIAGSPGKTGAAAMTATAALRAGAGLVTMAVPKSLNGVFEEKLTEVITEPVDDIDGYFSEDAYEKIMELTEDKSCIVIGPGMSTHPQTKKLVRNLLKSIVDNIVIDADGLNIIAEDPSILKETPAELVLTPHPGEMGRLISKSTKDVLDDKISIARKFAIENSVALVLKGADTIIATGDGKIHINTTGNPALSTAGTGDVLTGMIAGLIAQGLNPMRACILGAYIHGATADEISDKFGNVGIIATDLLGIIPSVIHKYLS